MRTPRRSRDRCASTLLTGPPFDARERCTIPSFDAVATSRPLGLTSTSLTAPSWSGGDATIRPEAASWIATSPSDVAAATRRPSREKASTAAPGSSVAATRRALAFQTCPGMPVVPSRRPSRLYSTAVIRLPGVRRTARLAPSVASHTRAVRSAPAVATRRSSGANVIAVTQARWPRRAATSVP